MSSPETPPPGDERTSALSGIQRAGIVLGAIAVLLIAFVIVRGGDDSGGGSNASDTVAQTATTGEATTTSGNTEDSATGRTDDSAGGTATDDSSTTTDDSGTTTDDSSTTTDDSGTTTDDSGTTTEGSGGGTTTDGSASETGETPAPAQPAVATIRVVGGQPQGGVRRLSFKKGERIRFKVRSDAADEIHVHGYDVTKQVPAGQTVLVSFPATIEGRFEVEMHGSHTQIAELEVTPS